LYGKGRCLGVLETFLRHIGSSRQRDGVGGYGAVIGWSNGTINTGRRINLRPVSVRRIPTKTLPKPYQDTIETEGVEHKRQKWLWKGHPGPLAAFSGGLEGMAVEADRAILGRFCGLLVKFSGRCGVRDTEKTVQNCAFIAKSVRLLCGFCAK